MRVSIFTAIIAVLGLSLERTAVADIVASEDFDGGATNLVNSNVPTLDGGGGDSFAVGATAAWPTTGGTPFSLADNSVGDVGDTTSFPGDTEGVFGQNSNFDNRFLGISDTRDDEAVFDGNPVTATWTFDISGFTDLAMSIDMGSMEGSRFDYGADTLFTFDYSIDGGSSLNAFTIAPGGSFDYRALDDGEILTEETALSASGLNSVSKILADSGAVADDTFLDKSLVLNGDLDTFATSLNGSGNQLVLTLNAYIPFEAAAFDNIQIDGISAVPEPSSLALFGVIGMGFAAFSRRRS